MDLLPLLSRCVQIERAAGEIYRSVAKRFPADPELCAFWNGMATDEREHAHKLETWRRLVELEPAEKRSHPEGFVEAVTELEQLVRALSSRATRVRTPDEAFAIALDLESSELDTIYVMLLQSSPIARFPDLEDTRRAELGRHHQALIAAVRKSSQDERNRLRAALLEADH